MLSNREMLANIIIKTPLYIGGELWSGLSAEIRNSEDINKFKTYIKELN